MKNTSANSFSITRILTGIVLLFSLALIMGCGTTSSPPATVTLVSIAVTPASASIAVNETQQFTATGNYSDGSTKSLNTQVNWTSSPAGIVTINASGLATAVTSGNVTITATVGAVVGSRALTVTPILTTITVTPASPNAVVNTSTQLAAIGTWSDGRSQDVTTQVTWASVDGSVASIDNAGLATALSPGSTGVNATLGTVSGSTTLTVDPASLVSIVISPDQTSVPAGISQPFFATGIFNNGTTQDLVSVNWVSSDASVASIDNTGEAATLKAGSITITAGSGAVTGSTTFSVLPAVLLSISFNPVTPSLAMGTTEHIVAVGLFSDGSTQNLTAVDWSSSDQSMVTVDGNGNLATVALGSATVTATVGAISNTVSVSVTPAVPASIAVTPANPSIPAGFIQQFTATGTFTDNTTQDLTSTATWTSSAGNIATVDDTGFGSGLAAGTSTITATFGNVSGGTSFTVTPALLQSVTVSPQNVLMTNGTTYQLTATGHYSDSSSPNISSAATWSSTDSTIASVDNTGVVTGRKAGTVSITASLNGVSDSTTLTVANHTLQTIIVTPVNPTVNVGQITQFSATGYFADGTTQDLTKSAHWSTSSANVATINSGQSGGGLATPKAAGTVTITATFSGVSGSTSLTIN